MGQHSKWLRVRHVVVTRIAVIRDPKMLMSNWREFRPQ